VRLFGGPGETTFACDLERQAVLRRKNGQKEHEKGSTRAFNSQRESSVSRFKSRFPGFEPVDSDDWPNIPTIGLKNRRTFALFTTLSKPVKGCLRRQPAFVSAGMFSQNHGK
jgi:hypothetical protein